MRNFVITIGRQTGSGGREIAERLARRLGVVCYDKNALMELAQRTGGYEEVQAFYEEQPVNSLLYAIAMENFEQNIGEKTVRMHPERLRQGTVHPARKMRKLYLPG